jgi:hypothetical protein
MKRGQCTGKSALPTHPVCFEADSFAQAKMSGQNPASMVSPDPEGSELLSEDQT